MNRLRLSALQFIAILSFFGLTFFAASASYDGLITLVPEQDEIGVIENKNKDYESSVNGVSFSYPKDWDVQDRVINSIPYIRIENINARGVETHSLQEGYLKIEILAFPDEGLSLDAWVNKQNQRSQPGQNILERKETEVAGEKAIYQLEEYTNFNHTSQAIFVAKNEKIYIINFSNNREENREIIKDFITSFRFNP